MGEARRCRVGDLYPTDTITDIGQAPFEFVKANGFLNLVWARLEFQLFCCVNHLVMSCALPVGSRGWPRDTKARLKWLHSAVSRGLPSSIDASRLRDLIIRVEGLADERNVIVHSRYAGCKDAGRTIVFQMVDVEEAGMTLTLTTFTRQLSDITDLNVAIAECSNEHLEIFRESFASDGV